MVCMLNWCSDRDFMYMFMDVCLFVDDPVLKLVKIGVVDAVGLPTK